MPEIVTFMPDENLIFVEGFGKVTYEDVKNTFRESYKITKMFTANKTLSDHTKVESVPEYVEVFNLGSMVGQFFQNKKIALIYREEFEEDYRLFERSVNKRGGNLKLFKDRDLALNWLNAMAV